VITIRDLRKRHGDRLTLAGVTAEIAAGERVAVVGASGCGKTTLLRCLNALESFDDGGLRVAGLDLRAGVGGMHARDLVRLRSAVGMVFQELHLFPHLTVLGNVTLAPRLVRREARNEAERRGKELLGRVGLADRTGAYPHELSGGQKQRVALVRALAQAPDVLLLDEPTSALDPGTAREVANTIVELTAGRTTVVLVTHDPDLARSVADRVLRLENGSLTETT
jgi:ABC-type polar amino acid transport system ATPase subunit